MAVLGSADFCRHAELVQLLVRGRAVSFKHVGHHDGVRQTMRRAVLPAERVRDGMDVAHVRHRKGDARLVCGVEHVLARLMVGPVCPGTLDVGEHQVGGLKRKLARLLGGRAPDVGLDGVGERVHARG